jgi:hypothetical protein
LDLMSNGSTLKIEMGLPGRSFSGEKGNAANQTRRPSKTWGHPQGNRVHQYEDPDDGLQIWCLVRRARA